MSSTRILRSHKSREPVPKNYIRRFPPEIRIMIYNIALQPVDELDEDLVVEHPKTCKRKAGRHQNCAPLSWQLPSKILRPTPELLAALRPDADLYSEALVIFYKLNTFPLTRDTIVYFKGLKKKILAIIQRMTIFLTKEDTHYQTIRLAESGRSKLYTSLPNLTHLGLIIDASCTRLYAFCMNRLMTEHLHSVDDFVFWCVGMDKKHWNHNLNMMKKHTGPFFWHLQKRDEGEGKSKKWYGSLWDKWDGEKGKGGVRDTSVSLQEFWREDM